LEIFQQVFFNALSFSKTIIIGSIQGLESSLLFLSSPLLFFKNFFNKK
jgi:hypothetical protein